LRSECASVLDSARRAVCGARRRLMAMHTHASARGVASPAMGRHAGALCHAIVWKRCGLWAGRSMHGLPRATPTFEAPV
jgi:hypothetical protein